MSFSLDASDRVALDTCTLDDDALVDDFTADRYRLGPTAAALLAGCDGRARAGDLATEHARAYGVDPGVLLADLGAFVAELASVGLVRVHRPWRLHLVGRALDLVLPSPIEPLVVRRRFPATAAGCVRGVLWAGRTLALLTLVWTAAMTGAVATFARGVPLAVGLVPAVVGLTGLVTIVAHELGHLLAVQVVAGGAKYVATGPSQVGVIHDVHDPDRRRRVAGAGPLAGAAASVSAWALMAPLPHPGDALALPLALFMAAAHLIGLLPWCVDGRHLWSTAR